MKNLFLVLGATAALLAVGCSKSHDNNDLTGVYDISSTTLDEENGQKGSGTLSEEGIKGYAYIKSHTEAFYIILNAKTGEVTDVTHEVYTSGNVISGGDSVATDMHMSCLNQRKGQNKNEALNGEAIAEIKKHKVSAEESKAVIAILDAFMSKCADNSGVGSSVDEAQDEPELDDVESSEFNPETLEMNNLNSQDPKAMDEAMKQLNQFMKQMQPQGE